MPQLALLLVCVIWGSTFFSQQVGVRAIGDHPLAACLFLALRFSTASVLMALFVPRVFQVLDRRTILDGVLLSIPFSIGFVAQVSGLQTTTPTISALLTNLSVIATPILGVLFFREKVARSMWFGAVISLIGVGIMTNPKAGGFGGGEALTLVCAVAFAFQIQLTDLFTKRSSPLGITFVMFVCTSILTSAALVAIPSGWELLGGLGETLFRPDLLWTVLYNASVASVIGVLLMNLFQRHVTPTRAAVIYLTEPVFAGLFAMLFVGEAMTGWKIAGGLAVIGGNLLCEVMQRRRPPGPAGIA